MSLTDTHIIGGLDVNDGTTYIVQSVTFGGLVPTKGYAEWLEAGRDEFSYPGVMFENSTNTPKILVQATTTALLNAALEDLRQHVAPGKTWQVLLDGASTTVSTTILRVDYAVPKYVPGRTQYEVAFTIRTVPGWIGTQVDTGWLESDYVSPGAEALWGYYDLSGIEGTMLPLCATYFTTDQASKMFAWGIRTDHASGFEPLQDYDAHATADAKGGKTEDVALDASTFDASSEAAGAAELDAAGMSAPDGRPGRYAVFARYLQDATTDSNVTARAVSKVGSVEVPTSAVAATAAVPTASGFEVARLGEVSVPCAGVPTGEISSGWSSEASVASHSTADSYESVGPVGGGGSVFGFGTTFACAACRITGATLKLRYGYSAGPTLRLRLWDSTVTTLLAEVGAYVELTPTPTDVTIRFATPVEVAAGTYAISVSGWYDSALGVSTDTASGYANGAAFALMGSTEPGTASFDYTTADLYFSVLGQTVLGFPCTVGIQFCIASAETGDGHTAKLDQSALVPTDEGYAYWCPASAQSADAGMVVDAQSATDPPNIYPCDATGPTSSSVLATSELRGNPVPRPYRTNRYVFVAYTPSDATPTHAHLRVVYRPRWGTPLEV